MQRFFYTSLVILLTFSCGGENDNTTPCTKTWQVHSGNPIIPYNATGNSLIWNDPCVMKMNDGTYKMWLSEGPGTGENPVKIHDATSADGTSWTINTTPLLEPGTSGQWDDKATETPSVIRVGSTYHMYYSGCKKDSISGNEVGCDDGVYDIGHATSTDGITWNRDPNNPVIKHDNSDVTKWPFYNAAEPAALYNSANDTIYVYYHSNRYRGAGYCGNLTFMEGICLATSPGSDGSTFTHHDADSDGNIDAVLTQSADYPVEQDYRGYSTPYAFIDSSGTFHLFYDVVKHPCSGNWEQVALAHATSSDGKSFTEVEPNIFVRGGEPWTHTEVRSPSVIEENGIFMMWYAGHTDWFSTSGIGYATHECR